MEVTYATARLAALCSSKKALSRKYGAENANKVGMRIAQLLAADTLADMRRLPGAGCHELSADRKGDLAVDLSGGYRLVFTAADPDSARKRDGGLDWTRVTAVVFQQIEDYH